MKKIKCLGVWMDHANAHLFGFPDEDSDLHGIHSDFTNREKRESLHKGELHMHHKEQQEQRKYYESIAAIASDYDKVLLFGPTDAKSELHNIIKDKPEFAKVKIDVVQCDNITENQKRALVREHFSN